MGSRALDELRAEQRTMRKFLDLLQQQVGGSQRHG